SGDRRFPTPQPTTSHILYPNQQRKVTGRYPISNAASDFVAHGRRHGAGGMADGRAEQRCTENRARNFVPNGASLPWMFGDVTQPRTHAPKPFRELIADSRELISTSSLWDFRGRE